MSIRLEEDVIRLLNDENTVKILATSDENGNPHVVVKQSLSLWDEGKIAYLELIESSITQKNLTRSIWFNKKVSVLLKGRNGESWQIKGKPIKAVVAGQIFEKSYVEIRQKLGDVDLAAVWIIEPEEVINESYFIRKVEEETKRPVFKHLDRLAK